MARPLVKVEVEGLRDLRRSLREAGIGYGELKEAGLAAAGIVANEAGTLVPVLSGRLAATIRAAGQAKGAVVRAGKKAVPYAGVIHFGWAAHGIEPDPFLYDALDNRRGEVVEAYQRDVDRISRRV